MVHELHQQYGPVVRIGPNEISFNSLSAQRTIFGAGSGFERTAYYRMFDVYGHPNLFSIIECKAHAQRKKLVSHIYANQTILGPVFSTLIQKKVQRFVSLLNSPKDTKEIFTILHFWSFDTISEFVYGPDYGGTSALLGSEKSQQLIDDLLDPHRRRLAWFRVHFPSLTTWLTTRTGWTEKLLNALGLMPMKKPFVYSGIRAHAWESFHRFKNTPAEYKASVAKTTLIGRLFEVRKEHGLTDEEIASECADHLLAGIDTTADTLMFLIWALSLPQNKHCQDKLRQEVSTVHVDENGLPAPKDLPQLQYLSAVIRECLRLYAPIPTYEPRSIPIDTVIDGYKIPAGTIVGMSAYCLHRNEKVYPSPLTFDPERWISPSTGTLLPEGDERNRHFWAFSSGARMCIGMHLANAEMLTMAATIYRKFRTSTKQTDTTPLITSRYETFGDESVPHAIEHECWVDFEAIEI